MNNAIATIRTYVDGYIYTESGDPLTGVTIYLVFISNGKRITDKFLLEENSYEAWTDQEPAAMAVVFTKPGYQTLTIPFSQLAQDSNITMKPSSNTIIEPWMIPVVLTAAFILIRRKKKKNKVGFLESKDLMTLFLLVGGIIAFNVVQKILEKFGLWGGGKVRNEQQDPKSAWKVDYWRQFTSYSYSITTDQAKAFARQIHDAFTLFQDDYNSIMGVFSQMRTKANVSYLAYVFQQVYSEDLLAFLTDGGGVLPWDGLSTDHINTLINLVARLPTN